jgi:hypothetical protein
MSHHTWQICAVLSHLVVTFHGRQPQEMHTGALRLKLGCRGVYHWACSLVISEQTGLPLVVPGLLLPQAGIITDLLSSEKLSLL